MFYKLTTQPYIAKLLTAIDFNLVVHDSHPQHRHARQELHNSVDETTVDLVDQAPVVWNAAYVSAINIRRACRRLQGEFAGGRGCMPGQVVYCSKVYTCHEGYDVPYGI